MRIIPFLVLSLLCSASSVNAQGRGVGLTTDPFILNESKRSDVSSNNQGYASTSGRTLRSSSINTGVRNLVLIGDGQSNMSSVGPSAYSQTNGSAIDNFNIYDGAMYNTVDPVLGASYADALGVGSIMPRLADLLITNNKFDRVILVPIAVGGTSIAVHGPGGELYDRPCVAMRRLAARGIVPGMTNVTFAYLWGQGESDSGTAQATYQTIFGQIAAKLKSCSGISTQFNGRIFVTKQTMVGNTVNATIQAAQVALIDNASIFSGGDIDALTGGTNRQTDGAHLTATGQANAATAIYNAMHASGSPY